MKKLIYLFVACCISTVATAQKVTEKNLQGTWNIAVFDAGGIYINMATDAITLSEELKSQLTPDMMTELDKNMKEGLPILKLSNITFTGNTIKQNIAGEEKSGTFIIKDLDGKQHIVYTYTDGTTSDTIIAIKDKKLHLSKVDQDGSLELIFNKG